MMLANPGDIHFKRDFYFDRLTGTYGGKYFLVLAELPGGDFVARLLTSRPHARPKEPPCFHGDPYPGFYLGVLGSPLIKESWLDLRSLDDFDGRDVKRDAERGDLPRIMSLSEATFRAAAECVATANDTTRLQERAIRDTLARTAK